MKSILKQPVVLFSRDYMPLARITVQRAVVLIHTGRAEGITLTESAKSWMVRSPNLELEISEHVRLLTKSPARQWRIPPVNRREVFKRDGHRCAYCGSKKELTIDHYIPRSKGGTDTWDNVVTACSRCNSLKGNRLPKEAGMILGYKLKAPTHPAVAFAKDFWEEEEAKC